MVTFTLRLLAFPSTTGMTRMNASAASAVQNDRPENIEFIPAFLIEYSNSAFTNPHEVVLPDEPEDHTGDFTHMGAKFWGMETARHKATTLLDDEDALQFDYDAHNWVRIGFKQRAEITKITISTKWFTGNHVEAVSVYLTDDITGLKTQVLERADLNPDSEHEFDVEATIATECMVMLYYEGGIARINCFGTTAKIQKPKRTNLLKTAAITHVSNAHYGKPADAVRGNREELHMVGWESARTGYGEQALFHLKRPCIVEEFVVDTYLHRLNAPLTCHIFGIYLDSDSDMDVEAAMAQAPRYKIVFRNGREIVPDNFQEYMARHAYMSEGGVIGAHKFKIKSHVDNDSPWKAIVPFGRLRRDTWHRFRGLQETGPFTHILFTFYPNGGIHGLKLFGTTVRK